MNGKVILITGGTGSFGQTFTKFVCSNYKPKKVIIFSRDEYKQYNLLNKFTGPKYRGIRFFLGDVRDKDRLKRALNGVDIVIHAAALKQITLAEANPQECVKTNIYGSQNLIDACIDMNVKKVIALSTDKAVNPINLYGATKLAAEKLFINSNLISANTNTVFSVVRYGNVLSSRGSVIPFFKDMIKQKKNFLPITNLKMTRFFISLEDSANFVSECINKMYGGEIFIPKMPSIKIMDIAKALNPNIKFKIIGLRPGEKLHEALCATESSHLTYQFKKSFLIIPSVPLPSRCNFKKIIKKYNGKIVKKDFEYVSNKNNFVKTNELKKILNKIPY